MDYLDLALKPHWYDEIKSGRKKKEYRDMNNLYYTSKLLNVGEYTGKTNQEIRDGIKKGRLKIHPVIFDYVRFHCGNQTMVVKYDGLDHEGNNWVIKLGKVISTNI